MPAPGGGDGRREPYRVALRPQDVSQSRRGCPPGLTLSPPPSDSGGPSAGAPPARDIWISSALRGEGPGLRESPVFGRLDFLGSSRQKLAFSMGYTQPKADFFVRRLFPAACFVRASRLRSEGRPRSNASPAGRGGSRWGSWQPTSQGSIRHCGETKAAFSFLQGIVDLAPFMRNFPRRPRGHPPCASARTPVLRSCTEQGDDWARQPKRDLP